MLSEKAKLLEWQLLTLPKILVFLNVMKSQEQIFNKLNLTVSTTTSK
jgi:hypothetical protein